MKAPVALQETIFEDGCRTFLKVCFHCVPRAMLHVIGLGRRVFSKKQMLEVTVVGFGAGLL